MKKIISFCIVVACSFISSSNAHIQHYNKLNLIQFDIFRNDSKVGYHHIAFTRNKGEIIVQNEISFDIKKLGISFYQYKSEGTEIYAEDGSLLSFVSKTSDNGTIKSCNINRQGKSYIINGTQYKGTFNKDFLISSYWNHEILKKNIQISGISCQIRDQQVSFVKNETIAVNGTKTETSVFDIQGKDLNTQVWYRKSDMAIVKQILHKKGVWRYEIQELK